MRRAIANGTYSSGDGRTYERWTLDALRCVERHGSAPRPYSAAPVWTACVTELAEMGITKTARARAESFGAFDATRASSLAHWWILHRRRRAM